MNPYRIVLRFNFRSADDWDEWAYEDTFVPRVGDFVWVGDLRRDLQVTRVALIPQQAGATKPQLWAHVDLRPLAESEHELREAP